MNKKLFMRAIGLVAAVGAGTVLGAYVSPEARGSSVRATQITTAPLPPPPTIVGMDTFQNVAREETNAVVNITTSKLVHQTMMELPFDLPFDIPMMPRRGQGRDEQQTQTGSGSGFIIDRDGLILTNRHVVDSADKVTVTLANGKRYDAKVVGQDARTDVALVKIEPRETLTVLPLGDSDKTQVGEWVMAVGNPFGLGGNSVTVGVISFKGRPLDLSTRGTPIEMIQTDAAINPGNSGGPLINAQGEAIGINTLIISPGARQYSGVGFAVPINVANEILSQLKKTGHVVRGWLGVQIQAIDEDLAKSMNLDSSKGAIVAEVTPGGPAEHAGLQAGDVVREVEGRAIEDASDLSRQVAAKAPGSTISLDILRDGKRQTVRAKLGRFPDAESEIGDASGQHERLGMQLQTLTPDLARSLGLPAATKGVVVADVIAGSHAEDAGLRAGDVILSVNGKAIADIGSFKTAIAHAQSSGLARLRVKREDGARFLVLKLA